MLIHPLKDMSARPKQLSCRSDFAKHRRDRSRMGAVMTGYCVLKLLDKPGSGNALELGVEAMHVAIRVHERDQIAKHLRGVSDGDSAGHIVLPLEVRARERARPQCRVNPPNRLELNSIQGCKAR
jgi:hypothetical protein